MRLFDTAEDLHVVVFTSARWSSPYLFPGGNWRFSFDGIFFCIGIFLVQVVIVSNVASPKIPIDEGARLFDKSTRSGRPVEERLGVIVVDFFGYDFDIYGKIGALHPGLVLSHLIALPFSESSSEEL